MASSTEKQAKLKIKILKLLPKLAKAVSFQNPPYSPTKPHAACKMLSIIPVEARRKSKTTGQSFEHQEPSSPKVSCMGKIKLQKNYSRKGRKRLPSPGRVSPAPPKNQAPAAPRIIRNRSARNSEVVHGVDSWQEKLSIEAPSLSKLKSFSSGHRDSFGELDWLAVVKPVDSEYWSYCSNEEGGRCQEEKHQETVVSYSASLVGGKALQPRREVNLWKRRTMAPPGHLQLDT